MIAPVDPQITHEFFRNISHQSATICDIGG